ncbi:hypothetical protein KQX54_021404 [Cotesia glomerata]|uniref:Uncharacterized protein n=1 Tax=Cotesia glomerata TaxID=32391 RepID=A0AAV7IV25_COTGL|nr:hypothetical protein KQX54_021404 [Cotesia glomerata]
MPRVDFTTESCVWKRQVSYVMERIREYAMRETTLTPVPTTDEFYFSAPGRSSRSLLRLGGIVIICKYSVITGCPPHSSPRSLDRREQPSSIAIERAQASDYSERVVTRAITRLTTNR